MREQTGVLLYGDRVEVLARRNDSVKVRTTAGRHRLGRWPLLDGAGSLAAQRKTPRTNSCHARAGSRSHQSSHQFARAARPHRPSPLSVLDVACLLRLWAALSPIGSRSTDEKESPNEPEASKKEDWFLVRATATRPPGEGAIRNSAANTTTQPGDQTVPIAGWVVARFVSLDLPDPVRDGTSSANIRPIAWFELNRVNDEDGEHPQYLVAGTRGPEGQTCDFTTLRVFTWNRKKSRYETAFIENDLCGALPIRVGKSPKGEPEFRFHVMDAAKEERVYHLIQTSSAASAKNPPPKNLMRPHHSC